MKSSAVILKLFPVLLLTAGRDSMSSSFGREKPPDKAEALQCAEKADPRVDLEWMRIRYERDLDVR